MKNFKLLKDTPTHLKGEIFTLGLDYQPPLLANKNTLLFDKNGNAIYVKKQIKNFNSWFKEIKK